MLPKKCTKKNSVLSSGLLLTLGAPLKQPLDAADDLANKPEKRPETKAHALYPHRVDEEVDKPAINLSVTVLDLIS
jgi:hypothetical protein